MNNENLIDKYRKHLLIVHGLTILTITIVEIVCYILLHSMHELLPKAYLWTRIVPTIIINICVHLVARYINKSDSFRNEVKNASVIYATLVTSFAVSFFHREFIIVSCAFIFPMVLCAMFNDRKLLYRSFFCFRRYYCYYGNSSVF